MAAVVDNLRVDHRVTVIRDFTDGMGFAMRAGDTGIIRELSFDQIRLEVHVELEREGGRTALVFPLKPKSGPRFGNMRELFELGEDVTPPRPLPAHLRPGERKMIARSPAIDPTPSPSPYRQYLAAVADDTGRLKEAEDEILRSADHIGVAASVAEMYAQRMRMFQRAGDEPRAAAAFKHAIRWMRSYASSATSGGEGAALSDECDRFHEALTREFGYDPTEPRPSP